MKNQLTTQDIDKLLQSGVNVDLGDVLSKGFNYFFKNVWLFLGAGILLMLTLMVSYITIIGPMLIVGPLLAGYFIALHQYQTTGNMTLGNFYEGFKSFGQIIVMKLLLFLVGIVAAAPLIGVYIYFLGDAYMNALSGNPDPMAMQNAMQGPFFLFIFLSYIPLIIVYILYCFTLPFIVIGKMKAWDAMEASRKLAMKNFWKILALLIIGVLVSYIGVIALFIGFFATYAIIYCFIYAYYHELTKSLGEEDDLDIIEHLVEE